LNGWPQAEREAQYASTLQACFDNLVEQGIDISAYNSNENAADINDLRLALGYDKIIYYGQSYGTLLGQFLMRNFPDILEAVILDGTLPAEYTTYAQAFDTPASFQRVFAACAADAACNANYPNLEATLAELMAEFRANPKAVEITEADGARRTYRLDDVAIMGGLFAKMYNGSATLPADIYRLKENDPTFLAEFIPKPSGPIAKMMQIAINCSDDPTSSIDEFGFDAMDPLYVGFARDDAMQHVLACSILQTPQLSSASDTPVTSDIPVLLLNGELDPATAAEHARLLDAELPDSQYILFPGHGHVQSQFPCAVAIMAAFAADPAARVDTSCIPPAPSFETPFEASVTSDDGSATITMALPAGFAPVSPGQWLSGQTLIFLRAFPAGTSVDEALKAAVETTSQPFDAAQVADGEPVAGQPTKVYRGQVDFGGAPFNFDFIAFETAAGAYVIQAYQGNPALLDAYRQSSLPALLNTVVVTQ
jgi:pimeloyl-ACP methyl ester carboxylesterase